MKQIRKIKKYSINTISLILLLLMIVSSTHKYMTFIGVAFIFIFFIFLIHFKSEFNDSFFPKLILFSLLFQNFAIGIGAHSTGNFDSSLSLVTQVPTMLVYCLGVNYFLKNKWTKMDKVYLVYVSLVMIFFFIGEGPFTARAIYFRNFTIFYLGYIIGKHYLRNGRSRNEFIAYAIKLGIIASIFGIIGWIIGKEFYLSIGVLETYLAKQYSAYVDGLPGNFRTLVGGHWVNRLASLYYEPVNFSYFMAFVTILSFFYAKWKIRILFVVCAILTFGKGGLLVLGASFCCYIFSVILRQLRFKKVKVIVLSSMFIFIVILAVYIGVFATHSYGTYMHYYGIISGIPYIMSNPLGHGLGTAGNILRAIELNGNYVASETGLINMLYQIGVVGFGLFMYFLVKISDEVSKSEYFIGGDESKFQKFVEYLPYVLIVAAVFQENTLAPQTILMFMLIIGAFATNTNKNYILGENL